jgi:hypothetical protein
MLFYQERSDWERPQKAQQKKPIEREKKQVINLF